MPLPKPRKGEKKDDFVSRCIADDVIQEEYATQKERIAVCYSLWEQAKKEIKVEITKTDAKNKIVKGIVYSAGYLDTDGETMTKQDVQSACWNFLKTRKENNIDIQHDWKQSGCVVVENYMTEKGDPNFPEDSWIMAVQCTDEIWDKVEKGELNGFSFGGSVEKYPARVLLEVAKEITGKTEPNLNKDIIPEHTHEFLVHCDKHGQIIGGKTGHTDGHRHTVSYGTAVDKNVSHSHRIDLNEDNV